MISSLGSTSLPRRALLGAGLAVLLGLLFFYGDGPPYDFGFRVFFPLLTVSFGGAAAGVVHFLTDRYRTGGRGWWVNVLCALVFLVAVWITAVAGFAVTGDWD